MMKKSFMRKSFIEVKTEDNQKIIKRSFALEKRSKETKRKMGDSQISTTWGTAIKRREDD
jgi:hypothetical protein